MARTVIYDNGLLQIAEDEESDKLAELDRVRNLDLGALRLVFEVFSLSTKNKL